MRTREEIAQRQAKERQMACLWYAFGVFDGRGRSIPDGVHAWARRCGVEAYEYGLEDGRRSSLPSVMQQFREEYGAIGPRARVA